MTRATPRDLVQYLAEFELSLGELAPEQVAMFVAARNAAPYVDDLEVPIGRASCEENDATLTDRTTDAVLDVSTRDAEALDCLLPTDEMEVSLVRSVEDLPRIFPSQWLLEEVQPDLFYVKLAHGELLMPVWQRPPPGPGETLHESRRHELSPEPARAESTRQHAYLLLDTSSTMQDHDRRGTVARGLALAFLRKGYQQGAQLAARPFAADVGDLSSGAEKEDFLAIARRVIALPNAGQTRLQTALDQAAGDLRGAGPSRGAHIMLITDGISRLSKNPLAGEKLHTFILGDLFEDKEISGTIDTLRQWSQTFHRIWTNRFAEVLAPTWRDCQAAGLALEASIREAGAHPAERAAGRLRRLIENARFLVRQFKKSLAKNAAASPELRALEQRLAEAQQALAETAEQTPAPSDERGPVAMRRPGGQPACPSGTRTVSAEGADLWQGLLGLAKRVLGWARAACRALVRRRRQP